MSCLECNLYNQNLFYCSTLCNNKEQYTKQKKEDIEKLRQLSQEIDKNYTKENGNILMNNLILKHKKGEWYG